MKIKLMLLSGAIGMFIFSGCTAKGPQFSSFEKPKEGNSKVYIYRTSLFGGAINPDIFQKNLDTNESLLLGEVKSMGYISTEIKPGNYEFWAKTEAKNEVLISAKANETYCIEHYITMGFFIGHPQFKIIPIDKCEREIVTTNLSIKEK
jgi:hypothetical protein